MPSLCGSAEATREWFRAFAAHSFLTCRPLRPRGVRHRYPELRCRHWPSPNDHRLGTPDTPAIRSTRAVDFVASSGSLPLQPARLLAPLYGSDWNAQPSGTFTSRLSTARSPSPLLDITTTATGLLCWRDSNPLEWQLASLHGHSRPVNPVLSAGPCPLRFEKQLISQSLVSLPEYTPRIGRRMEVRQTSAGTLPKHLTRQSDAPNGTLQLRMGCADLARA